MKRKLLLAAVALLAAGLLYSLAVRPWFLRWGATDAELSKPLPGDSLVQGARGSATRAITINAPPERVWPWIVQIGQEKGGFYSYTWLENLFGCRIVNADRIHPEWQSVKPGDGVRLHPAMSPIPVALVDKGHALVLGGATSPDPRIPPVTWAFVVEAAPANTTRLLIRWRARPSTSIADTILNKYMIEPIHFVMERRMMLGIRDRAEGR
jgi:hypothetical protein